MGTSKGRRYRCCQCCGVFFAVDEMMRMPAPGRHGKWNRARWLSLKCLERQREREREWPDGLLENLSHVTQ